MYFERTVPPEMILPIDDFRQHLGLVEDEDATLAEAALMAAQDHLCGRSGHLGRAATIETARITFAAGEAVTRDGQQGFDLDYMPLVDVVSLECKVGGVWQAVSAATYDARAIERDLWRLRVKSGQVWPVPDSDDEHAWRVTFRAGLAASLLPLSIHYAVKLLATHFFEHRGEDNAPIPAQVYALIAPFKAQTI